jgi:hypothetical protein
VSPYAGGWGGRNLPVECVFLRRAMPVLVVRQLLRAELTRCLAVPCVVLAAYHTIIKRLRAPWRRGEEACCARQIETPDPLPQRASLVGGTCHHAFVCLTAETGTIAAFGRKVALPDSTVCVVSYYGFLLFFSHNKSYSLLDTAPHPATRRKVPRPTTCGACGPAVVPSFPLCAAAHSRRSRASRISDPTLPGTPCMPDTVHVSIGCVAHVYYMRS